MQSLCGKATLRGGSASSLKRARPWVEEFVHFLTTHRGLGYESCRSARYFALDFLSWRFKNGRVHWSLVSVEDLWSYASDVLASLNRDQLTVDFQSFGAF